MTTPSNSCTTPRRVEPPPTISDVIARIEADESLFSTRRRDLLSGLRTLCRVLDRAPDQLPAFMPVIAEGLAGVNLVDAGITAKRLANVKSDALAAFKLVGISQSARHRYPPLTGAWKKLWDRCEKRHRTGLSRFVNVCSQWGITPEAVGDDVIARFIEALPHLAFKTEKAVRNAHRLVTRLWNECAANIEGWPATILEVPDYSQPKMRLPLSDYPASFQHDVAAHLSWLGDSDPFSEHRPPRRYKPTTIRLREQHIITAASLYMEGGGDVDDLSCLADLVAPERVKTLLRAAHEARGQRFSTYDHGLVKTLRHIARYWVQVDETQLGELKDLQRRMGPERVGMTAKNRALLRELEDPEKEARLLFLPEDLVAEAVKRDRGDSRSALTMQTAVAIAILLIAPIRMANLIALELGRQLIRPGGPNSSWCLVLDAGEVKNEVDVDFVLGDELSSLINLYVDRFRPRLAVGGGGFLFPNEAGGHKHQSTLAHQIKKVIRERVGIGMSVHQFRHLAPQQMLSGDNPANLAEVQQLLGHKNLKTTINYYGALTSRKAALKLDGMLAKRRQELADRRGPKRPGGRPK